MSHTQSILFNIWTGSGKFTEKIPLQDIVLYRGRTGIKSPLRYSIQKNVKSLFFDTLCGRLWRPSRHISHTSLWSVRAWSYKQKQYKKAYLFSYYKLGFTHKTWEEWHDNNEKKKKLIDFIRSMKYFYWKNV
jgi:hypothetical protein